MSPDRYRRNCTILGISSDSSWPEIRRHYKRLAGTWHPDRHHHQGHGHDSAEKRFKEITAAFRELSAYYRDHHRPPEQYSTTEEPSRERTETRMRTVADSGFSSRTDGESHHPATTRARRSRTAILLFAAWGLIALSLLWQELRTGRDPEPQPPPEPDSANPAPAMAQHSAPEKYFTIGSTVGEVYSIHGVPSRTVGNVWYYGKSKVLFGSGKVVDWEHDPNAPLRARMEQPSR